MTIAGWILMSSVITVFTGTLCWCLYKVVTAPESPEHFAHIELNTPDMKHD
jgi:hypothetical protein